MFDFDTLRLQMEQTMRETERQMRRAKIEAAANVACMLSGMAHCDALGRGVRPGPGWWEVVGGRNPRWRGEKLVMRYRLPSAKRAWEAGA